jgi:hypothetical protein
VIVLGVEADEEFVVVEVFECVVEGYRGGQEGDVMEDFESCQCWGLSGGGREWAEVGWDVQNMVTVALLFSFVLDKFEMPAHVKKYSNKCLFRTSGHAEVSSRGVLLFASVVDATMLIYGVPDCCALQVLGSTTVHVRAIQNYEILKGTADTIYRARRAF